MSEPPPPPQPPNPNFHPIFPWMWNPPIPHPPHVTKHQDDENESWEVRAFAQDTSSLTGTTWPPRSYTCSFCRREFRSAQALGGHMNVHRRDRARLQLAPPLPNPFVSPHSCNYPSTPLQLGFCLLCHQLGSPCNGVSVGVEPPAIDVEPCLEINVDNSGEEEGKEGEVELDLELRLGN